MVRNRLAGIASVLVVLASGYWLGTDSGPEQFVAAFGAVAAYIALDRRASKPNDARRHDLDLYSRIRELFTPEALLFLRDFDFGNSFNASALDGVRTFFHEFDDSVHEFLDRKVEKERNALHRLAKKLVIDVSLKTFPTDMDIKRQRVSMEWDEKDRRTAVRELNETATYLLEAHDQFTRVARKRLLSGGAI